MDRRTMLLAFAGSALATPIAARDAPQETAEDSKEDVPMGRKIVEQFAATLSVQDLKGFATLFAEDYVNHQVSAAAPLPPGGTQAKQLTLAHFAARLQGLPDLKVTIEAIVATEDKAAASFVYEGTHQGLYIGFEPTGRRLRFTSCDIFSIREGKITEHWGMGDIAGVLMQLRG
ncbi:MAG: ester cyclase [Beijerinckiaceae bacterium]